MGINLGLDIGAISLKLAALGGAADLPLLRALAALRPEFRLSLVAERPVLLSDYRRLSGSPVQSAYDLLQEVYAAIPAERVEGLRVTGSGSRAIAKVLGLFFENEFKAIARAIAALYPRVRTVFEIGGESSKYLRLSDAGIVDYDRSGECAAGTGSFLDQQALRMRYSVEEVGALVRTAGCAARIAGRCSVFAKSDMIHAQQKGYSPAEILRGLCDAVARNYKSAVVKGRPVEAPVALIGAVSQNAGVTAALREAFGLAESDLLVPAEYAWCGAIGAAILEAEDPRKRSILEIHRLRQHDSLPIPEDSRPLSLENVVRLQPRPSRHASVISGRIPAYLGLDIGSVSTNLVLLDDAGAVVHDVYLRTAGRPIEVVQQGLAELERLWGRRVEIQGVGTTGSGRELTAEFVGADVVNDEITAHKTGAVHISRTLGGEPVDTIFEIGGQDSKFISIESGVVVDFAMNEACAAGTGSFLEEQAEKLGISIQGEFAALALAAHSPTRLGERCTVFMERDVNGWLQKGETIPNLVAGLAYSIALNYLNRVVRGRKIGKVIYFQGGTAYNDAVTAAFAHLLGKKITVPPYNGVMGAVGMALIARQWRRATGVKSAGLGNALAVAGHDTRADTDRLAAATGLAAEASAPGHATPADTASRDAAGTGDPLVEVSAAPGHVHPNFSNLTAAAGLAAEDSAPGHATPANTASRDVAATGDPLVEVSAAPGHAHPNFSNLTAAAGLAAEDSAPGHATPANTASRDVAATGDPLVEVSAAPGHAHPNFSNLTAAAGLAAEDSAPGHATPANTASRDVAATGDPLVEVSAAPGHAHPNFSNLTAAAGLAAEDSAPGHATAADAASRDAAAAAGNAPAAISGAPSEAARPDTPGLAAVSAAAPGNASAAPASPGEAPRADFVNLTAAAAAGNAAAAISGAAAGANIPGFAVAPAAPGEVTPTTATTPPGAATRFRGYDLRKLTFSSRAFVCKACSNYCDMKEFVIEGQRSYWGDKCSDKFRKPSATGRKPVIEDLFAHREHLLDVLAADVAAGPKQYRIGLPRAMSLIERLPFWRRYFAELGMETVLSPVTDPRISAVGLELAVAQPCYPVQVAHGHVHALTEAGVDYILVPNMADSEAAGDSPSHYCPWNQTLPWVLRAAPGLEAHSRRFLIPTLHFQVGPEQVKKALAETMRRLGVHRRSSDRAVDAAWREQREFQARLRQAGRQALAALEQAGEPGLILAGRPYNIYDRGVNCDIPRKLRHRYGANVIPLDFLETGELESDAGWNMYWSSGRKILQAARVAASRPNLHLIYITNFKCGPDSYIKHFAREAAGAPLLVLQFDGHGNDAGYMTRAEAYLDSKGILRCYQPAPAIQ